MINEKKNSITLSNSGHCVKNQFIRLYYSHSLNQFIIKYNQQASSSSSDTCLWSGIVNLAVSPKRAGNCDGL